MIANANRDAKRRPEPFTFDDFFPEHAPPPRPMSIAEKVMAVFAGFRHKGDGDVIRRRE